MKTKRNRSGIGEARYVGRKRVRALSEAKVAEFFSTITRIRNARMPLYVVDTCVR